MFIGHFALGFAAKRVAPQLPLVLLLFATQLADMLWPFLLAAGVEQVRIEPRENPLLRLDFVSYPFSHSLLLLVVWGVVLGGSYRVASAKTRAFVVLASLVVSHWVLDWITHRPDMPLYPGGPAMGLGLWNSVAGTLAVESMLFAAGLFVYAQAARDRSLPRRWRVWTLALFLLVGYVGSLLGPPPPSVPALYTTTIGLFGIILVWSWWAEKA